MLSPVGARARLSWCSTIVQSAWSHAPWAHTARLSSSRPCSRNAGSGCVSRRAGPASAHHSVGTPSGGRQHSICHTTVEEVWVKDGRSEWRFLAVAVPGVPPSPLIMATSRTLGLDSDLPGKGLRARVTILTSPRHRRCGGRSPGLGRYPALLGQKGPQDSCSAARSRGHGDSRRV